MAGKSKHGESADYRAALEAAQNGSRVSSASSNNNQNVSDADAANMRQQSELAAATAKAQGALCKDISGGSHCDEVVKSAVSANQTGARTR